MAEGDGALYNDFKEQLLRGLHDLVNDEIKVSLHSGYTPNIDTHQVFADVSGTQMSGTGYTSGGTTIGNSSTRTVTQDNSADRALFDGPDASWTQINVGTPSHAIMRNNTQSGGPLIGYWELGRATNGGDYALQWNAVGIITLN
jgi:hypothetical protein